MTAPMNQLSFIVWPTKLTVFCHSDEAIKKRPQRAPIFVSAEEQMKLESLKIWRGD